MKCAYHNNVDAVATCNVCGKALCGACASVIHPPQCIGCYRDGLKSRLVAIRRSFMYDILIGIVVAIGFPLLCGVFSTSEPDTGLWERVLYFCVPFGWRFFNKITPSFFLWLPLFGWIIYFGVKFLLSAALGLFIAPYTIWKRINEMRQVQKALDRVVNKDNRRLVVTQ